MFYDFKDDKATLEYSTINEVLESYNVIHTVEMMMSQNSGYSGFTS